MSRILVPFYPLAGRLRRLDGGLELECNAKGVELVGVESSQLMSDFGEFLNFKGFEGLFPRVDYHKPIEDHSLDLVQLTWFRCGGLALGMTISHVVSDGLSATHFIGQWAASLACGEPLEDSPYLDCRILHVKDKSLVNELPNFDRNDFFPSLPMLKGGWDDPDEQNKETVAKTLTLTKSQVGTLKMVANGKTGQHVCGRRPYSRFEAITAHIWRCACKVRELASEQMTALCFCVDARRRMNPPLPLR